MRQAEEVAVQQVETIDLRDVAVGRGVEIEPDRIADDLGGGAVSVARARPSMRLRGYVLCLVGLDGFAAGVSALVALTLRFGGNPGTIQGLSYSLLLGALPVAWLLTMWLSGAYDDRVLVSGTDEFRRVLNGSVWLLSAVAAGSFALHLPLSRAVIALALINVTCLSLVARCTARRSLQGRLRNESATLHRAVVVGPRDEAECLIRHMRRNSHVGFGVTAVHVPSRFSYVTIDQRIANIMAIVERTEADTIALSGTSGFNSAQLRRLAWRLEGTGVRLMVVPALTDLAGPRITVHPVDGLPLLRVEEPGFHGPKLILKRALDLVGGLVFLLLLSPFLLLIGLVVWLSSGRPMLYSQIRVGRHGKAFKMYKFRTMQKDADLLENRDADPDGTPVRTKPASDPRVTTVGRVLRRYSVDELPQLLNVVLGAMSLVGPRPHRPVEVAEYCDDARRRLLIKPGVTGMWQVSGRSALPWDEAVRLDLRYVENWSIWLDIVLILKTLRAVTFPKGAY